MITLPISRRCLISILLVLSVFPALWTQTVSGQQLTTVTVGYTTKTYASVSNSTILSVSNTTKTLVQTNTVTSQVTIASLSSTQITMTDTLPNIKIETVQPSFLETNASWLLPVAVFAIVLALLTVGGRIMRVEK